MIGQASSSTSTKLLRHQRLMKIVRCWSCHRAVVSLRPASSLSRSSTSTSTIIILGTNRFTPRNVHTRCGVGNFLQSSLLRPYLSSSQAVRFLRSNASDSGSGKSTSQKGRESDEDEGEDKEDEEKKKEALKRATIISMFATGVALVVLMNTFTSGRASEFDSAFITWNVFVQEMLAKGEVESIHVYPGKEVAVVRLHEGAIVNGKRASGQRMYNLQLSNINRFEEDLRRAEQDLGIPEQNSVTVNFHYPLDVGPIITLALFAVVTFYIYRMFKSGKFKISMMNPMSSMTKANFKIVDPHAKSGGLKTRFSDVAGLHEAKVEIREFVDYLKRPTAYTTLGAKLPKGALLLGPPGCGKTLLAKAVATESSAPFIAVNGTEFIEVIGGLGAARMRDLFKEAKSRSPCIIYIDEIDAIGRKRSGGEGGGGVGGGGGSGEEEQTLNQLLVEMDGMDSAQGVIVIASTNRADVLDKALLRRGRFDRHVTIDPPTALERKEIFELYLRQIKLDKNPEVYSQRLALMTPGFSGADIHNVVNEAAIRAATTEKKIVTVDELDWALQRILAGPEKRSRTLSLEEREVVAYHESGHALIGWLLRHTDALLKVSIVPRTSAALGFAQYSPADRKLFSKEELYDRMCMTLGGRAAENVVFGRVTTGAEDDLKKVTRLAYGQVGKYGMSEKIGPLSFSAPPGEERSAQFMKKPYSKQMQHMMDQEASDIVTKAYFYTEELIKTNRNKLELLAKALLKNEVLHYEDVKKLIGPPPYGDKQYVELADHVIPTLDEEKPLPSRDDEEHDDSYGKL
uniref:AAA+ ATPase domain-containing protein n=1 Tax=Plectus sambesii TaxID=2011161 RepID=A0A914WJQ0_9BILA